MLISIYLFVKVANSSASDSPKDFDEVPSKIDLRDNSKTVSTEALMTVYHPQDAENLDPKMVRDKVANSFWNLTGRDLSIFKTYSSKAADFHCGFASLLSSACSVF